MVRDYPKKSVLSGLVSLACPQRSFRVRIWWQLTLLPVGYASDHLTYLLANAL
jgi:hypothetical protein